LGKGNAAHFPCITRSHSDSSEFAAGKSKEKPTMATSWDVSGMLWGGGVGQVELSLELPSGLGTDLSVSDRE